MTELKGKDREEIAKAFLEWLDTPSGDLFLDKLIEEIERRKKGKRNDVDKDSL